MISSVPISAAKPPKGPSSSRAICPRLRPSRRVDSSRITMSCTQPPSTAPTRIHSVPGQVAELRGERRPHQRSRAGDGGEMMAEDDHAVGRNEVAAVVEALRRRGTRGIDRQHARRNPGRVEAVAQQVDADGRGHDPEGVDRLVPVERDAPRGKGPHHGQQRAQQFVLHAPFSSALRRAAAAAPGRSAPRWRRDGGAVRPRPPSPRLATHSRRRSRPAAKIQLSMQLIAAALEQRRMPGRECDHIDGSARHKARARHP